MDRLEFLKRTLAAPIAAVVGVAVVKKQQKGRRIGMFGWWETPQHKEEAIRILKSSVEHKHKKFPVITKITCT